MIREIRFVDPINSVSFINKKADILIGHSGNLSMLLAKNYMDYSLMLENEEEYIAISEKT